jgi:hypothetical protein
MALLCLRYERISTLAAVCDGERIRKVEPQGDGE